jgi:hypothetical protein
MVCRRLKRRCQMQGEGDQIERRRGISTLEREMNAFNAADDTFSSTGKV